MSKAAHDLIKALKEKHNWLGDKQAHDLQQLSSIFKDVASKAKADSPPAPATAPPSRQTHKKTQPEQRVPSPRVKPSSEPQEVAPEPAPQLIVESGQSMPR